VFAAGALGWGLYARERQALIAHLRERAARAEADQTARVMRARRDERDRIAREMHDVLAHRLSMTSLHAGALHLHPDLHADAHDSAEVIRAGAHEALEELRAVIGVLRHHETHEPEPPQPGLEAVSDLVGDARRCGTDVRFDDHVGTGQEPAPPAVSGRVAYRVVQEALTNARKHAPGSPVHLVLDGAPGNGLRIQVTNPAPAPAASRASAAASPVPGSGLGLIGLTERVELVGGRLTHEAANSRFRLEVHLPWLT
jgi:signal transduction histidine kinase